MKRQSSVQTSSIEIYWRDLFRSKIIRTVTLAGMLAASLAGLSACRTSVVVTSDPYYFAWRDVYGRVCSYGHPYPGCNFYSDGTKIFDYNDPYYYGYYYLEWGVWDYIDSYGFPRRYVGYAWLSPTGILYDYYGYALNERGSREGRDLVSEMEALESQKAVEAGKALAQAYALAEDKGIQIAKTLQDFALLGRKRERTDEDLAQFSERLFGVKVTEAARALKEAEKGNLKALDAINENIANHWGTSPETSAQILKDWFQQ